MVWWGGGRWVGCSPLPPFLSTTPLWRCSGRELTRGPAAAPVPPALRDLRFRSLDSSHVGELYTCSFARVWLPTPAPNLDFSSLCFTPVAQSCGCSKTCLNTEKECRPRVRAAPRPEASVFKTALPPREFELFSVASGPQRALHRGFLCSGNRWPEESSESCWEPPLGLLNKS